ncbi:hypothetical protein [Sagittula stellata]|uniref:Uncharacterized protein n=1 Tax=Sagittula stellata (strain ATCC 700073 / DSM 11524 / E-37) TaxID=388399 RepID=A3K4C9_SAGS3|nr:hypothetical protein [Sagittula stellata]EBA07828.1 hypothetical protein SSE37_01205 [Sagittula stellata E-37]
MNASYHSFDTAHAQIREALLGQSALGLKVPFPVVLQAIASISALPGAGKRFTMTMRIRISGV